MRRQLPWVGWALGGAQVSQAPVPRAGLPSSSCPPGTPSPQPRPLGIPVCRPPGGPFHQPSSLPGRGCRAPRKGDSSPTSLVSHSPNHADGATQPGPGTGWVPADGLCLCTSQPGSQAALWVTAPPAGDPEARTRAAGGPRGAARRLPTPQACHPRVLPCQAPLPLQAPKRRPPAATP